MGDKKIDIDGEEYISSARAAELVGYTKDYVGQLAREGKIEARRVGRNWYIKESSINNHKLSVHYTLTKPKKSQKQNDEETPIKTRVDESQKKEEKAEKTIYKATHTEKPHQVREGSFTPKNNVERVSDENIIFEPYVVEKEEHDLFPKTMRREADVLTKTDIRYVKEQPPAQKDATVLHDGFRTVPVRKPTMAGIVKNESRESIVSEPRSTVTPRRISRNVPIDGVSNHTVRNRRTRQEDQEYPRDDYNVRDDDFDMYYERRRPQKRARKETSKVIPVVGSIVVFTIVVVFFILFSPSS